MRTRGACILAGTLAMALAFAYVIGGSERVTEDIMMKLDPTAQRAFAYGELHFNGQNTSEYNIDLAQHFFQEAASKDPEMLYLFHELARIYFLKGDFSKALSLINIQIANQGDATPNSYYIRGLIEGYMGDYESSATDYAHFLEFEPNNWAAINDYAWVLLKSGRARDAVVVTAGGLNLFPENPWLLNSNATGLYELGYLEPALDQERKAAKAVESLTEAEWSHAYPGNDPAIAAKGVEAFKLAVQANLQRLEASSTVAK